MTSFRISLPSLLAWPTIAMLLVASEPRAQPSPVTAAPWYRRSRALDLTGSNPRDSVVLTATGKRADRLASWMTFFVSDVVVHRQRWTSDDELYDVDSLRTSSARLAALMRTRLDDVLTSVKRQRINREQVSHMGDEAALRKSVPPPTHQVMFSFAFESSVFLAWDSARRRLFVFMECC